MTNNKLSTKKFETRIFNKKISKVNIKIKFKIKI